MNPERSQSVADVSVIIPAYNAGASLRRAVHSVLAQTRPPREILIVDDGSTDDTAAVAMALQAEHGGRIRLAQHADGGNHGVSAARNLGIDRARGEYVAFLDADDEWHADKLREQLEVFERLPAVGFVHSFVEFFDDRAPGISAAPDSFRQKPVPQPYDRRETLEAMVAQRLFMYPSTVVVRASLLRSVRFIEGLPFQNEDGLFHAMLACQTEMHTVERPLCRYHVTSESQLGRVMRTGMMSLIWLDLQIRICRYLRRRRAYRTFSDRLVRVEIWNNLGQCRRQLDSPEKWRHFIRLAFLAAGFFPRSFLGGALSFARRRIWKGSGIRS